MPIFRRIQRSLLPRKTAKLWARIFTERATASMTTSALFTDTGRGQTAERLSCWDSPLRTRLAVRTITTPLTMSCRIVSLRNATVITGIRSHSTARPAITLIIPTHTMLSGIRGLNFALLTANRVHLDFNHGMVFVGCRFPDPLVRLLLVA